jgi:hypothetical protein
MLKSNKKDIGTPLDARHFRHTTKHVHSLASYKAALQHKAVALRTQLQTEVT